MFLYTLLILLKVYDVRSESGFSDITNDISDTDSTFVPPYANFTDEEIQIINEAQSDLIFTAEQKAQMRQRMAAFEANFWTNGVVPYVIQNSFYNLPNSADMLQRATNEYAKYTCIKLRPKQPQDQNYLIFQAGAGCRSFFGMVGGPQTIEMSTTCNNYPQVILHEIGHALGLIHEQQRPDRDNFVTINWNNINRYMASNFDKVPIRKTIFFPYDYSSMMQYDAWAFSVNRGYSMLALDPQTTQRMGWYKTFSQSDIDRINFYYGCKK